MLGSFLGAWQWDRADSKQAAAMARANAPALVNPKTLPAQGAELTLNGEYIAESTFFLDNRIVEGRLGVAVLTPLKDQFGHLWLIQRGFVETGTSREPPEVSTPTHPVSLTGEWQEANDDGLLFGPNLEGVRLQRMSLAPWQGVIPAFRYQGWVHADTGDGVFLPWWEANVMPASRHLGYAFQWWGLSLAALITMWLGGRYLYQGRTHNNKGMNNGS
ncbi:Cytochrome oxidase assembly protein ShyY1 [Vreelandella arcis]|uniref:SURF1-like protein n=1 Tax=Vreelandella arcis TaxID=416873 RepID=A0A1G9YWE7_9GAMM|nr:Cytochrome oxidase assembly protein ShyY1 [Halomonas arcis]